MKILLADKLSAHVHENLSSMGAEVVNEPSLKDSSLTAAIEKHNPQVLVVRSTKVQAEQLQVAENLSVIVRAGAGTNTIDVKTASDKGIYVANCPGKNGASRRYTATSSPPLPTGRIRAPNPPPWPWMPATACFGA